MGFQQACTLFTTSNSARVVNRGVTFSVSKYRSTIIMIYFFRFSKKLVDRKAILRLLPSQEHTLWLIVWKSIEGTDMLLSIVQQHNGISSTNELIVRILCNCQKGHSLCIWVIHLGLMFSGNPVHLQALSMPSNQHGVYKRRSTSYTPASKQSLWKYMYFGHLYKTCNW